MASSGVRSGLVRLGNLTRSGISLKSLSKTQCSYLRVPSWTKQISPNRHRHSQVFVLISTPSVFQCHRNIVPQQDLLYLSKDMLTFLNRSRKHLENSMQVTIFFPSSCSRTNTKYYWMYDWFPWRLSVIALHTDEILSLVLFNCRIYFPKAGSLLYLYGIANV